MKYTLITKQGTIMKFYGESRAHMYKSLNGDIVFTQAILLSNSGQTVYN